MSYTILILTVVLLVMSFPVSQIHIDVRSREQIRGLHAIMVVTVIIYYLISFVHWIWP